MSLKYPYYARKRAQHALRDGEGLLFARQDGVEEAWRVVDKILTHHHVAHFYPRGSWGPKEANRMIEAFGGWHDPVVNPT